MRERQGLLVVVEVEVTLGVVGLVLVSGPDVVGPVVPARVVTALGRLGSSRAPVEHAGVRLLLEVLGGYLAGKLTGAVQIGIRLVWTTHGIDGLAEGDVAIGGMGSPVEHA